MGRTRERSSAAQQGESTVGVVVDRPDLNVAGNRAESEHALQVEQALLQARTLIESTVVLHRRRSVGDTVPVARTGAAHLGESVERLIARGHHAVSVALVGHGEFTESVLRVLGGSPGRAVVRVLCTAEIAPDVAERLAGLPVEQTEVRVSDSDLRAVLVVDGFTALMLKPTARVAGSSSPSSTTWPRSAPWSSSSLKHLGHRPQAGGPSAAQPPPAPGTRPQDPGAAACRTHGRGRRPRDQCVAAHLPAVRGGDTARPRRDLPVPGRCPRGAARSVARVTGRGRHPAARP